MDSIPEGFCQCGCGERTELALWTDKRRGTVKGQPCRFIHGHSAQRQGRYWGKRYERIKCACGCGELAPLHRRGWPQRWVYGHQNRKRKPSRIPRPLSFLIKDCGYETPCYVWRGAFSQSGYGRFDRDGRHYAAHRQAWKSFNGSIPPGTEICHRCDNPPCMRPDHLFAGTRKDNVRDMIAKGRDYRGPRPWIYRQRARRGEAHPHHVLTEALVREIRSRYARGNISERKLAAELGVNRGNVRAVLTGHAWAWLDA